MARNSLNTVGAKYCVDERVRGRVEDVAEHPNTQYLGIGELVELFNTTPGKIHRMIEQKHLAAVRVDGVLKVPALFILDGEPLPSLHGTLVLLNDAGYSQAESVAWLFDENAGLDVAPIEALRSGRKTEVRRTAQSLAF